MPSIPAAFTVSQADKVLELERIGRQARAGAALLLKASMPAHFSEAQAECVTQMLRLTPEELRATLADAIEPGALRDRLRAARVSPTGAAA